MSDTPRTDAECGPFIGNPDHALVYARFARQLERELAVVVDQRQSIRDKNVNIERELTEAREQLDRMQLPCECQRPLCRMRRELLDTTREQRDRLADALQTLCDAAFTHGVLGSWMDEFERARAALAVVKGGTP
jgi:hypothetical protein